MSRIAVTPPYTWRRRAASATGRLGGVAMCWCESISPGTTNVPCRSTTSASASRATGISPSGATVLMCAPSTTIEVAGRAAPPVPSMRVAPRYSTTVPFAGAAKGAGAPTSS